MPERREFNPFLDNYQEMSNIAASYALIFITESATGEDAYTHGRFCGIIWKTRAILVLHSLYLRRQVAEVFCVAKGSNAAADDTWSSIQRPSRVRCDDHHLVCGIRCDGAKYIRHAGTDETGQFNCRSYTRSHRRRRPTIQSSTHSARYF